MTIYYDVNNLQESAETIVAAAKKFTPPPWWKFWKKPYFVAKSRFLEPIGLKNPDDYLDKIEAQHNQVLEECLKLWQPENGKKWRLLQRPNAEGYAMESSIYLN